MLIARSLSLSLLPARSVSLPLSPSLPVLFYLAAPSVSAQQVFPHWLPLSRGLPGTLPACLDPPALSLSRRVSPPLAVALFRSLPLFLLWLDWLPFDPGDARL